MAVLNFPNIVPEIQDFGIVYNTQMSTSFVGSVTQTLELPGARWKGRISYSDMTASESAALKAFLLSLRGSSGRFYYGDKTQLAPFNNVTGTPTIESTSTRRIIKTTLGSGSPSFSVGDYIQLGTDESRELKMIIGVSSVGGDVYNLTIEPLIRRSTYIGLTIDYSSPTGVFALTSDDQASWSTRGKALLSDISLDFIEVFS